MALLKIGYKCHNHIFLDLKWIAEHQVKHKLTNMTLDINGGLLASPAHQS